MYAIRSYYAGLRKFGTAVQSSHPFQADNRLLSENTAIPNVSHTNDAHFEDGFYNTIRGSTLRSEAGNDVRRFQTSDGKFPVFAHHNLRNNFV